MSRADVWIRRVLIGAAALSFSAPLALAQVPVQATVTPAAVASPSVIGREVMQEVPQRPRAEIEVPPAGGLTVTPELANREVEFAHVTVAGATAFGATDFGPLLAPVLNRRLRFAEVVAALNRIAQLYATGGYVFYSLVLPQQDLDGRELKVVVVEGSVSGVEVQDGIKSETVRERIAALLGKLQGKKPLKRSELKRQLLLAADTPGVALRPRFSPTAAASSAVRSISRHRSATAARRSRPSCAMRSTGSTS